MSSTPTLGFIKDITAKNIKAVEQRLKKEKPNQRYTDPKQEGSVYTLLHKAVAVGCIEIVAALLKAGAEVNATDSKGKTPLHWLAGFSTDAHIKIAELLLKQKAIDIQAGSDSKATPLHEAAAQGNTKLLKLLLRKGAQPLDSTPGFSPMHAACQSACSHSWQSCMPVVEELLQQAPQLLAQQDESGFTPLMRLLQHGLWTDAKQLLAKGGCNMNAQGPAGQTALLIACSCPAPGLQLISDLLAAGASTAVQDTPAGNTPLLLATKLGGAPGLALARLLLQGCQAVSLGGDASGGGSAAATTAADGLGASNPDSSLKPGSINIHAANAAGETALTVAAAAALAAASATAKAAAGAAAADEVAALQLLSLVLEQQPDVPEQLAATLLQKGLQGQLSDAITAQLVTLLPSDVVSHAAAAAQLPQPLSFTGLLKLRMYRTAVAHLVKTSGKGPGAAQDAAGNTHLHNAVSGPDDVPELVAALLAVGLPADATNQDGDTALHVAARAGHAEACKALVAGGSDVFRRNNKNRTPGNQLKLPQQTKAFLAEAEEAARLAKEQKNHELWDAKMKATQTASAFGIRVT